MGDTKRCTRCGEEKPVEEFSNHKKGIRHHCRSCVRDYYSKWYTPEYRRERSLKSRYGITIAGYGALLASQDCRCWVCGKHEDDEDTRLHVDHDHATGKVRGLLCGSCNRALGLLGESPETIMRAYEYLLHNGESADAVLGALESEPTLDAEQLLLLIDCPDEYRVLTETGAA